MAKKEEEINNEREGKLKALQAAMSKIEKDFGKGHTALCRSIPSCGQ